MDEIIITLAPGQAGFYDELTGIHLNLSNKEARILSTANTMGLVKAVKAGKILVVSGSLGLETIDYIDVNNIPPTYYRVLNSSTVQNASKTVFVEQEKINEVEEVQGFNLEPIAEISTLSEDDNVEEVIEEIKPIEEKVIEDNKESKKKNNKKKKAEVGIKEKNTKGE